MQKIGQNSSPTKGFEGWILFGKGPICPSSPRGHQSCPVLAAEGNGGALGSHFPVLRGHRGRDGSAGGVWADFSKFRSNTQPLILSGKPRITAAGPASGMGTLPRPCCPSCPFKNCHQGQKPMRNCSHNDQTQPSLQALGFSGAVSGWAGSPRRDLGSARDGDGCAGPLRNGQVRQPHRAGAGPAGLE